TSKDNKNNYQNPDTLVSFNYHYNLDQDWILSYDIKRVNRNLRNCFFISQEDVKDKEVLIIGCGNGAEIRAFSELKPSYIIAVDLTDSINKVAQNVLDVKNVTIIQADACKPLLLKNSVDVVFCDGVLPHVQEPVKMIENMVEMTKPGGVVWFRTMLKTSIGRDLLYVLPRRILRGIFRRLPTSAFWKLCYLFGKLANIPLIGRIAKLAFVYYDPYDNSVKVTQLANYRRYGEHAYRRRFSKEYLKKVLIEKYPGAKTQILGNVFRIEVM
ncbi:MAG: methyltransferase domain-containing protein, partial [Candidatus Aureabacteria bacterium]|nr:methyltransferase domain-containing protein [Candidatus Auribacterota bacterium]